MSGIKKGHIPILFFGNKMDIPGAMGSVDLVKELELEKITDRNWHIT